MNTTKSSLALSVVAGCLLGLATAARAAESLTDDFADGLDARHWIVVGDVDLYDVDTSMGDVRISKPVGGDYVFQSLGLTFRPKLRGDFDVSVEMTNASITRVDGAPGNQIQLNIRFGGQGFYVVRSDESPGGNNLHVFLDPPLIWTGAVASTATAGRLRVVRIGTVVHGWFGDLLLFDGNFNTEDAEVNFALQNNGTRDATAVTFDNFSVVADTLILPPRFAVDWATLDAGGGYSAGERFSVYGTIGQPDAGGPIATEHFSVTGGFWAGVTAIQTSGGPFLSVTQTNGIVTVSWEKPAPGWLLEFSPTLADPSVWNLVAPATYQSNATRFYITVPFPTGHRYYRLFRP